MSKSLLLALVFIVSLSAQQINIKPVYDDYDQQSTNLADYYSGAYRLTGTALRSALHNIIAGDSHVSYTGLWTAYGTTDLRTDRGSSKIIWDIYSDIPGSTPPYEFTYSTTQCGNYTGEGSCYNREHTWCQSWFGNLTSGPYTDLFNVLPTDGYVNSKRSNYNYGEVGTATWTSRNGSKLGSSSTAGFSGTVFEPIDAFKGDIARCAFYVSTRYYTEDGSFASSNGTNKAELLSWYANVLYKWHMNDTVSTKEINRNNLVYGVQKNRNPFIDHPEFAAEIWMQSMRPQIVSVQYTTPNSIVLDFSRYLDSAASVTPANFVISDGIGSPVQITYGVNNDISKIVLTTSSLLSGSLYTIQIKNLKSINSVAMNDTAVSFTTPGSLPVELISFSANNTDKGVSLNWSTATEMNNFMFQIQRKSNQGSWINIGSVKGSGNSTVKNNYSYLDKENLINGDYLYRLKQVDNNGSSVFSNEVNVHINSVPKAYILENNYPNPFNPSTVIKYSLPFDSNVRLSVYNLLGQVVKEITADFQSTGTYEAAFNADDLSGGVYFYKLQAKSTDGSREFSAVKKMLYLK